MLLNSNGDVLDSEQILEGDGCSVNTDSQCAIAFDGATSNVSGPF